MDNQSPLVSVVVITYNSSAYVLQTLESAKAQTYRNIELVITDDCSTDNTVDICSKWLKENGHRFVRTQLVTASVNTGIPANVNRGFRPARGEWLKGIAGDDILAPDSITNYMEAVSQEVNCLVGNIQCFCTGKKGETVYKEIWPEKYTSSFFELSASQQHKRLLTHSFNFSPGVFMRKSIYKNCGDFDEHYRYLDDLPYWLNITSQGVRFELLPKVTVLYRTMHESAVFTQKNYFNTRFYDCLYEFRKTVIYPQVSCWNILYYQSELLERLQYRLIVNVFGNKKNRISVICYKLLSCLRIKKYVGILKRCFL